MRNKWIYPFSPRPERDGRLNRTDGVHARPVEPARIPAILGERLRRHGLTGCIRRVISLVYRLAVRALYLRERHAWYRLDLGCGRPLFELPAGLELMRAGVDELPLLARIETVGLAEARRRLASGADLWIVRRGTEAVFSCWVFRDRAPVLAAPGGWLTLPAGTVCMEDSVAARRYRGIGVALGAWSRVADVLAQQGVTAIVTHGVPPLGRENRFQDGGFHELA